MANEHEQWLQLGDEAGARVEFTKARGRIEVFVIQLEIWDGERWLPAVRYDNAHGSAHRDILSRVGCQIGKEWLPAHWTANEPMNYAIRDIRTNWPVYEENFWRD